MTNRSKAPFSPFTGGDLSAVAANLTTTITPDSVKELCEIGTCPTCAATHRTSPELAKKIDGEDMHCVMCGSEMKADLNLATLASDDEDEEEEDTTDKKEGEDEDTDEEEASTDTDEGDTKPAEASDAVPTTEKTVTETPPAEKPATETTAGDDEGDKKDEEEDKKDEEEEKKDEEDKDESSTHVSNVFNVDLMQALAKDECDLDTVTLAAAGTQDPVWYLFINHKPVATMTMSKASDSVKAVFCHEKVFRESLFAALANTGLTVEVANDFGLETIKVDLPVEETVKQAVDSKVSELSNSYSEREKTVFDTLKQCVSIAALGVIKNTFKDVENPLRNKLIADLNQVGVQNASAIVDRCFNAEGDSLMKAVLSKAYELREKTDDARNELAQMVESASYNYRETAANTEANTTHRPVVIAQTEESSDNDDDKILPYRELFRYSQRSNR